VLHFILELGNDNPFIESLFKTLKYHVAYPTTFADLSSARSWVADFVDAYNNRHCHSGLHYMTPKAVRNGLYSKVIKQRNTVMREAFSLNPQRWSRPVKQLPEDHIVYLNPTAETRTKIKADKDAA
jgi:putative transposase